MLNINGKKLYFGGMLILLCLMLIIRFTSINTLSPIGSIVFLISVFLTGVFIYFIPPNEIEISNIKNLRRIKNKSYLTDKNIFKRRKIYGILLILISSLFIILLLFSEMT